MVNHDIAFKTRKSKLGPLSILNILLSIYLWQLLVVLFPWKVVLKTCYSLYLMFPLSNIWHQTKSVCHLFHRNDTEMSYVRAKSLLFSFLWGDGDPMLGRPARLLDGRFIYENFRICRARKGFLSGIIKNQQHIVS